MKRCPKCDAAYADETLNFCLEDGEWLVPDDDPATAILRASDVPRSGGFSNEPETKVFSSEGIPPQRGTQNAFDKRLLLAPIALAVIALAGISGYRYFKTGSSDQITSIAVLPFQNRSDDADTDYLSDGLAESLIFRLSQLPGLKVSPTSSVMRYKGKETDVAKVAAELGVDAVMTGKLMKRGESLNISVELVDTRNNTSLWGEQYERKMSELLATQRDIAGVIVQKLHRVTRQMYQTFTGSIFRVNSASGDTGQTPMTRILNWTAGLKK
ncbi:MAG: hypothetical protein ABI857_05335 [Acidobacteriota bacterium]